MSTQMQDAVTAAIGAAGPRRTATTVEEVQRLLGALSVLLDLD
jgi:hypothetical protein